MRKLKLFFACLLMTLLSIGQVWGATENRKVTLNFTTNGGTNSGTLQDSVCYFSSDAAGFSGSVTGIVDISTAKNDAGTSPTIYADGLRIYKKKNTGNGGSITLSAGTSVNTITKVEFTAVSSSYVRTTSYKVDGGSASAISWSSTAATTGTISASSSVYIQVTENSNNTNQLRISQMVVYYTAEVSGGGSSKPTVTSEHLAWGANSAKVFINGELYDGHVAHNALPSLTYDLSATLTYESTNTDVATISSTGVVTIKAVGSTTIKATYPEDATYAATTVSYTLTVDKIWTVAGAQAAISALDNNGTIANQYVAGTISQVGSFNSTYSSITYYISDDGATTGQLEVYSGKGLNGANFSKASDLSVGADVLIKGELKKYKSGSNPAKNEINQNSQQVIYKPLAPLSWSEASYEADMSGSNTFPTLSKPDGVTVTYSSTNTDAATINPSTGAISLVAVGSTTIKATFTGNETYKANEVSYTLTVSNSVLRADISFEENGGTTVADMSQQSNLPNLLPTITKAGYNFDGWWTTSDFQDGTEAVAGAAVTSTDPITLYAKWDDPYTVTKALEIIDGLADNGETGNVYVSGIVCTAPSSLLSGGYLTYYISVDGTETNRLQVYKGKDENNEAFTDKDDVQKDDQVVVYGPLMKYVSGTTTKPEFNTGNYLYSLSRKADAELSWGTTEFTAYIGESNDYPTLTNDHGVTVTYSSSETDYATINPSTGAISLVAAGNTTITATFAGNDGYKADAVSYTLKVRTPLVHGSITYEENGGSEVADVADATELPDPLPSTTRAHYSFEGWWTTSTFEDGTEAVAGASLTGNTILYAKWTALPVQAYTYTSNVDMSGATASTVVIGTESFDAMKAGTSSAAGSVNVTVPAQATTIHFHASGWDQRDVTLNITAPDGITVTPASVDLLADAGASGNTDTYTLQNDPETQAYFSVTLSGNTDEFTLNFANTGSKKQFILFGVNQVGGVEPELDHITITGELTNKDYELGDELDKTGLTVTAYYTLAGAAHHYEDVTSDVVWSNDPLTGGQTSVDVTATYGGKSDTKACAINAVVVPTPEIILSESALEFSGKQYGAVANKTFNVTLKNVAAATVALSGDDAAKFSIDPAALTANGTVTVSVANTNVAGSFSATITVSDDAAAAAAQTVALTLTITADEAPAWNAEWVEATELYDGMPILITGVNSTTSKIYAIGAQGDNNRAAVEGSLSEGVLTPGTGTKQFTLEVVDAENNKYAIKTSDGKYLYAASSTKNYLRSQATNDNNGVWTLTVESATANGTNSRNQLKFNASNNPAIFSCYASGQTDIKLYTPKSYTRTVSGNYGTICLPKNGVLTNGTLFEIAYYGQTSKKIFFDEILNNEMVAGRPYLFKPNDGVTELRVNYTDNAEPVAAGNWKGLHGFYDLTNENATFNIQQDAGNYIMYSNQYWEVSGRAAYIENYRAYIVLSDITTIEPAKAPGTRRVSLNVNGEQTATDIDVLNAEEAPVKMMIDGQLFILRGEKLYDATGRLVK